MSYPQDGPTSRRQTAFGNSQRCYRVSGEGSPNIVRLTGRFSDIRIRQGEQGVLNILREHDEIRFPMHSPAEGYA